MKWVLQLQRGRKFLLGTEQGGHSPRPKPPGPALPQNPLRHPALHTHFPWPVGQPSRRLGCLWQGSLKPQKKALQAVASLHLAQGKSLAQGQHPVPLPTSSQYSCTLVLNLQRQGILLAPFQWDVIPVRL